MTVSVPTLMNRCQTLVGQFDARRPEQLLAEMRGLPVAAESPTRRAEQVLVTDVFGQMLARLLSVSGLQRVPEVASAFVDLAGASHSFEAWSSQWVQLTCLCDRLLRDRTAGDERVRRMLDTIDAMYADSKLNLQTVAAALNLSPSHAGRLLQQNTGAGFVVHLRDRRVAASQPMLSAPALSIKEIAVAVGYKHASQFSRQFRAALGMTPRKFRERVLAGGGRTTGPCRNPQRIARIVKSF